jgi:ketosteroid isomerase-like protein
LCLALAGCQPRPAAGSAEQAVFRDVHQVLADLNAHRADDAVRHDAPDVVVMNHGSPNLVGVAADLANLKQVLAASPTAHVVVSNEVVDVAASGDMAVWRASYVFNYIDSKNGKPVVAEHGNWMFGYRLIDNAWKIVWSVESDTGPLQ